MLFSSQLQEGFKIRKVQFVLSGNLGRKAVIEVNSGNTSYRLIGKRKIRININHLASHTRLQYLESNLSRLSHLKIVVTKLIKDFGLFPREVFYFLFFRYVSELQLDDRFEFSPELNLCRKNKKVEIWISRQAQLAGIFSRKRDQDIEWDMFRRAQGSRGYLLSVLETTKEGQEIDSDEKSYLPRLTPTEIENVLVPQNASYQIHMLKDVIVDRLNLVVQKNVVFPVHNFDFHEEVSRPTSLLFSKGQKTFYYKFDSTGEKVVDMVTMIPYSTNWYHFLIEGLPCFLLNQSNLVAGPILLPEDSPRNIVEVVKRCSGFNPVFLHPHQRIVVSKLQIIQEWRFRERFNFDERTSDLSLLVDALQRIFVYANNLSFLPRDESKQVVFMSRPHGLFRQLGNLEEVLNEFSKSGFENIEPSTLTIDTVAQKLNKANIVIAETGAALTNLLFCKKGTKVIEIQPPGVDVEFWQNFTKKLDLDHYVIPAGKAWFGLRSSHYLPIEDVKSMVAFLLR